MLGLLFFVGCPEMTTELSSADRHAITAVMDNDCRVPEDCTFGIELDGRMFMSPPPPVPATSDHPAVRLPRSSPVYRAAVDFGCITSDVCSLTGVAEEWPNIRLTLTRHYQGGVSTSIAWRVNTEKITITPIINGD